MKYRKGLELVNLVSAGAETQPLEEKNMADTNDTGVVEGVVAPVGNLVSDVLGSTGKAVDESVKGLFGAASRASRRPPRSSPDRPTRRSGTSGTPRRTGAPTSGSGVPTSAGCARTSAS